MTIDIYAYFYFVFFNPTTNYSQKSRPLSQPMLSLLLCVVMELQGFDFFDPFKFLHEA